MFENKVEFTSVFGNVHLLAICLNMGVKERGSYGWPGW